jgi:hypothetical protein
MVSRPGRFLIYVNTASIPNLKRASPMAATVKNGYSHVEQIQSARPPIATVGILVKSSCTGARLGRASSVWAARIVPVAQRNLANSYGLRASISPPGARRLLPLTNGLGEGLARTQRICHSTQRLR